MSRFLFLARRVFALGIVVLVPFVFSWTGGTTLGGVPNRVENLRALVVNEDQLVRATGTDGTEQVVLAGRLLVTELLSDEDDTFDWQLASRDNAMNALEQGEVVAVLTIPSTFSKSIASLTAVDGGTAQITLHASRDHDYFAADLASSVAGSVTDSLGHELSTEILIGLLSGIGDAARGYDQAAEGAEQLAGGVDEYSQGVSRYSVGVDGLIEGLQQLSQQTASLPQLSAGLTSYIDGVNQMLGAVCPSVPDCVVLQQTGSALKPGVSRLGELSGGIKTLADGGTQVSQASPSIRSGGEDLSDGANGLASGLRSAANQASATTLPDDLAERLSSPVELQQDITQDDLNLQVLVATLALALGMWLAALMLVSTGSWLQSHVVQSTHSSTRVTFSSLARPFGIGVLASELGLFALLGTGVELVTLLWLAAFIPLAFLALLSIHALVAVSAPRYLTVVSIGVAAITAASFAYLLPTDLQPDWMQTVISAAPPTWVAEGLHAIITQDVGAAIGAGASLLVVSVLSNLVLIRLVMRRRRHAWGFAVANVS